VAVEFEDSKRTRDSELYTYGVSLPESFLFFSSRVEQGIVVFGLGWRFERYHFAG